MPARPQTIATLIGLVSLVPPLDPTYQAQWAPTAIRASAVPDRAFEGAWREVQVRLTRRDGTVILVRPIAGLYVATATHYAQTATLALSDTNKVPVCNQFWGTSGRYRLAHDTLTLNPDAVRNALTSKTKCIMPVHMCGSMADLDALKTICEENKLILLEDACQSIGASYRGKMLGTIGDAGTFSFDFVKIITCAEGGAVMTNRDDVFAAADGYSDHGHDHKGADRGADLHPFVGYNFRISELHAAVGLAQVKKLDGFLAIQRKNHTALKNILSVIPGISFRRIPDEAGDSCTFLSWFLPSAEITKAVVAEMKAQGIIAGHFYWFDNNWHYIRKWDHLKNGVTLAALHPDHKAAVMHHANKDFSVSDAIMSRCVSTAIGLLWTSNAQSPTSRTTWS